MTDTTDARAPERDWRDTVFLPKTDFPMKAGLAQKEPLILERWRRIGLYDRLRAQRAGRERFILHDGPPYANGDIHMGHAMMKTLKDFIVRTQSLVGKDAPFVPGWDCHGLPIEWKVEEAYRAKKLDKDQVPVAQFRAECRAYAERWIAVQSEQFQRLGVLGDWADPYRTMDYASEAIIAGELLKFAESGQLYRGAKPVMWSPVEKTALAEAEVEYEDVVSTQIDVAFEITHAPNAPELVGAYAVIWTTTPWTIPVNQALAYGPEIDYQLLMASDGRKYVVAFDLIEQFFKRTGLTFGAWPGEPDEPTDAGRLKRFLARQVPGSKLAGAVARHPMWRLDSPPRDGEGVGALAGSQPAKIVSGGHDLAPAHEHSANGGGGGPQAASPAESPLRQPSAATSPSREGFFSKPRPFLPGDFVTTDAGTGLVHMAPDHGEDDFELCRAHGIEPVFAVDAAGMYRADWAWLGGQGSVINKKFVAADGPICSDLRAAGGLLAASDDYRHSYPHSWRSKAKVIFRATPQWFIGMDELIPSPLRGEGEPRSGEGEGQSGTGSESDFPSPDLAPLGHPLPGGERERTLRTLALSAIAETRWVPPRAENRIRAMVEARPDWVISRQRAWGVPIALYVDRRTGEYLDDPAVNARILAAFREGGADAWFTADHQALLGGDYNLADYEPQGDILDVWFDSGSTHAFVVEARYGAGVRADLYCEGSDQHRGWFQSSLLESCGTRGRAPYEAVLTHGFVQDENGRKMSKSVGNVVDPLKIVAESGADILRLWVAQADYFDDLRIGKAAIAGASDTYRKLRNTFRYLLGALEGYSEDEALPVATWPELERYVLHLTRALDRGLRDAAEAYDFNRYIRLLTDFANEDLSAFLFDIRKDSLYCDAASDPKRRAYRTLLDLLFHALVRYAAPILPFTTEEVWQTRFPSEDGSVHLLEWPELPGDAGEDASARWLEVRALRERVTEAIEPLRREKTIRSSLEAEVTIPDAPLSPDSLAELFIVARVEVAPVLDVEPTTYDKCGRCWRHLPEVVGGGLCDRCASVVEEIAA